MSEDKPKDDIDLALSNIGNVLREKMSKEMAEKKQQEPEQETVIKPFSYDDVDGNLLSRMRKKKKKLEIVLWAITGGYEDGLKKITKGMDAQDFNYKGKRYIIDRNKIQNRFGQPTYNHEINQAVRGLSFVRDSGYNVDARNYCDGVKREHFTALWGKWKLPFIALIISMAVALVMGMLALVGFLGQKDVQTDLDVANICLTDIPCMQGKIATIQAQIGEQQQRDNDTGIPPPPSGG